jgi:8-oxo-dGTP diphosphatase
MSYLTKEQNERFLGTGAANAAGDGLQEFLDKYDPKHYDLPANTVDMAIFKSDGLWTAPDQPLKLLMIKRGNHPSIGWWALPGGFVDYKENLEDAAARELEEETGVKGLPLVQLRTWGDYDRDPRMRIITTSYMALVEGPLEAKAGDDAADARWFDVSLESTGIYSEEGYVLERYSLSLVSGQGSPDELRIGAEISRREYGSGLLRQVRYRLRSSDRIASDHALVIADALLELKSRIS